EISWKQKSREKWLKLGDKNSKYFHQIANFNRRRNHLDGLIVNGNQVCGQWRIAEEAINFYSSLYQERWRHRPFSSRSISKRLCFESSAHLLDPMTPHDIWNAIKVCAGDKAPGPDGFSMAFIKSNWSLIKNDLCAAIEDFFSNLVLPAGVNITFLVLIPKVNSVAGF
ncbi:hypothetical protein LINPERPRIM_LOCUS39219, partial [Linum perenne]